MPEDGIDGADERDRQPRPVHALDHARAALPLGLLLRPPNPQDVLEDRHLSRLIARPDPQPKQEEAVRHEKEKASLEEGDAVKAIEGDDGEDVGLRPRKETAQQPLDLRRIPADGARERRA